MRSGIDGKLNVGPDGLSPSAPRRSQEPGSWLGLALLFNLFTLEHNAICDRLKAEYPSMSDDELFERRGSSTRRCWRRFTPSSGRPASSATRRSKSPCALTGGVSPASGPP